MFVKRTTQGSHNHCPSWNLPVCPSPDWGSHPKQRKNDFGNALSASSMDFLISCPTPLAASSLASSDRNLRGWDRVSILRPVTFDSFLSGQTWSLCCSKCITQHGSCSTESEMEPLAGADTAAFHQRWPARLLLWVSALSCSFSSPASLPPSLVPRVRSSYTLGRTFLGLDKCNACIGTSICKKFFKEEIRSESPWNNSEKQIKLLLVWRDLIYGWELEEGI